MKIITENKALPKPRRRTEAAPKRETIDIPKDVEDMPPTSAPRSNVIPFPTNLAEFRKQNPLPKTPPNELGKREVNLPKSTKSEGLVSVTISGDSLRDMSVFDGDSLICQTKFDDSELKKGRLILAELPCLGLVVKFYHAFKNKVILRSANPKFEDLIYDADLVGIKALVIQSVRNWN